MIIENRKEKEIKHLIGNIIETNKEETDKEEINHIDLIEEIIEINSERVKESEANMISKMTIVKIIEPKILDILREILK